MKKPAPPAFPKLGVHLFVVYDHPIDHPNHVVIREQFICPHGHWHVSEHANLYISLEAAREFIHSCPMRLVRIPRHRLDDPKIVETWTDGQGAAFLVKAKDYIANLRKDNGASNH